MSLTKNFILIGFTILVCYLLLVLGDILLGSIIEGSFSNDLKEAKKIESLRERQEDSIQIKQARSEGYSHFVYPYLYDSNESLVKISKSLVSSPLANPPYSNIFYCNEGYGLVTYKTDRFGFRNEDLKWDKKVNMVFIGDSYINGACVKDEHTISYVFQKITGLNSLSLGASGNNPYHYAAYANIFIPRYLPENVVIAFYANDNGNFNKSLLYDLYVKKNLSFFDKSKENKISLPKEYMNLFLKKNKLKISIQEIQKSFPLLKYFSLPTIRYILDFRQNTENNNFSASEQALFLAKYLCKTFKCNLNVIYLPNSSYWRPDARADRYSDSLKEFCENNKINFIDASNILDRKKGSIDYAIKGPHLSPEGYKKVAKYITKSFE